MEPRATMTHEGPKRTDHADRVCEPELLRARLSLLGDALPGVVLFHDGAVIDDIVGDFQGLLGWTREEAVGQPVLGPWIHGRAMDQIRERIAAGFQGQYQTNAQHRSGELIPVELFVRQRTVCGNLVRVVVIQDLRERLAAQARLAEGDARFRTLLEVAYDGMVVHRGGYVLESNEGFARMVGATLDQVIGMTPGDVVTPESVPVILDQIRADNTDPYEVVGRRLDGTLFPMQIQGRAVPGDSGIRVTGFRDLTRQREAEAERQRLQQQLMQAQKLEGLGVMAGGIAHDFNNLLTVILGCTELAQLGLPKDHPSAVQVQRACDAAALAALLTRQMLAYAGRVNTAPERLDISSVVRNTSRLLGVAVPKGCQLELDFELIPLPIEADRGQLEQVVMNLITNAAEALDHRAGTVTLRTRRVTELEAYRASLVGGTELPAAPCALLEVSDTGVGIAAEDLPRIFDPFFSTQFEGRGLGLATVLGIVRSSDGAIALRTELGRGTRISVLLPLSEGPTEAKPEPPIREGVLQAEVLVVDDEPEVAAVAVAMLEFLGCTVEVLESGEALIQRLARGAPLPSLVLLDRVMPGMGGDAAREILRTRWPQVPVIVMSGRERPADLDRDSSTCTFLAKPFRTRDLAAALGGLGLL